MVPVTVKTDSSELVSPGTNFLINFLQNMGPSEKFGQPPRDEIMKTHKHISLEPAAYLTVNSTNVLSSYLNELRKQ